MSRLLHFMMAVMVVAILAGCGGAQNNVAKWAHGPMPSGGNFDGVYQSDFGRLEMTVEGDSVVGLYENDRFSGRIQGKIEDNLLNFTWTQWNEEMRGKLRETHGSGVFQYVIDDVPAGSNMKAYHRLQGWWGYPDTDMVNRWNATKLSDKAKKRIQPFSPERSEMEAGDEYQQNEATEYEPTTKDRKPSKENKTEEGQESSVDDIF